MSFNPELLSGRDRVRFAVGDTNPDVELLPDTTYNALLSGTSGDEARATIQAADFLIVHFAQEPNKLDLDGGKTAAEWGERIGAWRRLADRLRVELATSATQSQQGARSYRASRFEDTASEYARRGCND